MPTSTGTGPSTDTAPSPALTVVGEVGGSQGHRASGGGGGQREAGIMKSGSEPEAQRARVSLPANTREAESCASSPCCHVSELPSANTPPSGGRGCQELGLPHLLSTSGPMQRAALPPTGSPKSLPLIDHAALPDSRP